MDSGRCLFYGTLEQQGPRKASVLVDNSNLATAVGYTHGAPAMPENLTASLVPGGVALTWTPIKDDRGIHGYINTGRMRARMRVRG